MDVDEDSDQNLDLLLCWICQHRRLLEAFGHIREVRKSFVLYSFKANSEMFYVITIDFYDHWLESMRCLMTKQSSM